MTNNMVTGLLSLYGVIASSGFLTGLSIFTVEQEKEDRLFGSRLALLSFVWPLFAVYYIPRQVYRLIKFACVGD